MGGVPANPPAGAGSVSELKARIEAERSGQPFLLYRDGSNQQRLFALEPGCAQASVGRRDASDLVLDWDDQVSRLHAVFERVEQDWTVVDDGLSRNGTFVNGERLTGRRRLSDGDTVRFGGT
jgi:pSer/pThr/pTyr-binding forkhead associated (FHA) protein